MIHISMVRSVGAESTTESAQLRIYAPSEEWLGTYDHLEVWRSLDAEGGPYTELTAPRWVPARLPADAGEEPSSPVVGPSVALSGKQLIVALAEDLRVTITFQGADPISFAEAARQIQQQGAGLLRSYVTASTEVVVETARVGADAVLVVSGGDAAPILGLPTETPVYGRTARLSLSPSSHSYSFTDVWARTLSYYKIRYRQNASGAVGYFSAPVPATQVSGVAQEYLIYGQVRLIGLDGMPLKNQLIRVFSRSKLQQIDDALVSGSPLDALTDSSGRARFLLVRGAKVSVAIDGTDIVRDVTVPLDAESAVFNLLDPAVGEDDAFRVRVPVLEYAPRRTL